MLSRVALDDELPDCKRGQSRWLPKIRVICEEHVGIEAAALGGGVLGGPGGLAHVGVHVFREFVSGYDTVVVGVRRAAQPLDDVVSEDAMTTGPNRHLRNSVRDRDWP